MYCPSLCIFPGLRCPKTVSNSSYLQNHRLSIYYKFLLIEIGPDGCLVFIDKPALNEPTSTKVYDSNNELFPTLKLMEVVR